MKRLFYFILLTVELFVGSLLMISMLDAMFYVPIAALFIVTGLLIWQIVRYIKTDDPRAKRKVLRNIALIMLLPVAVFVITYFFVAIAFIIAFA